MAETMEESRAVSVVIEMVLIQMKDEDPDSLHVSQSGLRF